MFREKIKYSLEVLTHVLRQSYISGHKLKEGFRRVGQLVDHNFPLNLGEETVDYTCMISQCLNKEITAMDTDNMQHMLPIAANRALRDGMYLDIYCHSIVSLT
jgi:hypothetical protein